MLKFTMEQNIQIRNMETEMDKLIKEKEQNAQLAMVPLDAVPLTTIPTTGTSTSTTPPAQPTDVARKLTKEMEDMSMKNE